MKMIVKSLFGLLAFLQCAQALNILQIVPGFTNSHILFNYRLAEMLTAQGHTVTMLNQMEMGMVVAGDLKMPKNTTEYRVPIHFTDTFKSEGLKLIFQTMMFQSGSAFDLYWTAQEFKSLRLESCEQILNSRLINDSRQYHFDLAIGHFHDLCPLAVANQIGIKEVLLITHGTSLYDFVAVQSGVRTFPSVVPHPLSSFSDRMSFFDRIQNVFWHLSTIDFVNLPQNLLHDENAMFKKRYQLDDAEDLWSLSQKVRVILINGERFLDFPRALPIAISFMGELNAAKSTKQSVPIFTGQIGEVVTKAKNLVIFSLGTVSNTTQMPKNMVESFVEAFARFSPDIDFLWRMEADVPQAKNYTNIHLLKWLPQKDLMKHPKLRLLIAHGGYNSFLEASKAGVPIVLMPLFADQFINVKRAQRFGTATTLDKLNLSADKIESAIREVLDNKRYHQNARQLAGMLAEKPSQELMLNYGLKLATLKRDHFALKAAQKLNFLSFYNFDVLLSLLFVPVIFLSLLE
ncbi:UDP-glucuronosyltransferase [Aphelenchoides bicaudatus]|nr:UDP-glucuronosyltransferase [Aphelenchoides bicaudatus]